MDCVLAERSPAEKVTAVKEAAHEGTSVMVGDGINDAPALAAADVGVALGARGATASSEAADIVLLLDRIDRLADGVLIARRARYIALQSIFVGMGLSSIAMAVAAFGFLPPVNGALLQEAIDVAVILNALRALSVNQSWRSDELGASKMSQQIRKEHRHLLPGVKRIRHFADCLDSMSPMEAHRDLIKTHRFLVEEILPHDEAEDAKVYPIVAKIMGGTDPTATMTRAHLEISHLVNLLGRTVDDLPPEGPGAEDVRELKRILYGLHAILSLHFAQEEESFLTILDSGTLGERVSSHSLS